MKVCNLETNTLTLSRFSRRLFDFTKLKNYNGQLGIIAFLEVNKLKGKMEKEFLVF